MIRLLIFGALVYLLYRALKSWIFKDLRVESRPAPGGQLQKVDDVMVKDPQCNVYFPKRKALQVTHKGETLFFCSQECKQKYLAGEPPADEQPKRD